MKIQINNAAIDEAIFKILEREEVRVGGWIPLSAIKRQWMLTGLRRADLPIAMARLDSNGYIYLQGEGDEDQTFAIVRNKLPMFRRGRLATMLALKRAKARLSQGAPNAERRLRRASAGSEGFAVGNHAT